MDGLNQDAKLLEGHSSQLLEHLKFKQKGSYDKINFGLYRSSMSRDGHYSKVKDKLQNGKCALSIVHSTNVKDPSTFKEIGETFDIGDCKVITDAELQSQDYLIEKWAHETCRSSK